MTRLATPLLAATLVVSPAAAASGQTTVALTGGVSFASFDVKQRNDPVPPFESATRPTIGLALAMPLWENLGIGLNGRYTRKGPRWSGSERLEYESSMWIGYLEFAALLRMQLPLSGNRVSWYGEVGPAVAYKTSCTMKEVAVIEGITREANQSCRNRLLELYDFDWGLSGGAGLEIGISQRMGVSIGLLYTLGLRNVHSGYYRSLKNRAVTLQAGIVRSIG